jgi:serine/threonine protein kinase
MPCDQAIIGRTTRYRVGPLLGSGYYADVFEVRELLSGALWAGKVYPAEPASKAAARWEIAALGTLSHPRMPAMQETFEQSGLTWVIMDLVPPPSLRDDVEARGPLEASAAFRVCAEACELLDYCGSDGWTYRDLHPRNIHHLTPGGVIVVDFDGARPPRAAGEAGGRGGYRAPEVAASALVHRGCHVFSLAGCIYFALTGDDPPAEPGALPRLGDAGRLSAQAVGVLERCRLADPAARPTERLLRQLMLEEIDRARAS